MVKHLPAMQKGIQSSGQEDPWRKEWLPTPGFLPGESCEQRTLASTIHGVTESDATKHAHQPLTLCLFAHLLLFLHHEFFAQSQGLRSSSSPPLQSWSLLKDFNTQLVACSLEGQLYYIILCKGLEHPWILVWGSFWSQYLQGHQEATVFDYIVAPLLSSLACQPYSQGSQVLVATASRDRWNLGFQSTVLSAESAVAGMGAGWTSLVVQGSKPTCPCRGHGWAPGLGRLHTPRSN